MQPIRFLTFYAVFAVAAGISTVRAHAQSGGVWQPLGPAPITNGQVTNINGGEVDGAIHTVVAHPTNADVLWVGAVNGGVWKTTDATALNPHWSSLTDGFGSLSIGAMDLDPTDATHQTLVAGIGRFSSFGRVGGDRIGLLRSTDGGSSWTLIDGGGALVGRNISGVAARGSTIVISVNVADSYVYGEIGIFRSTDGGATFVQMSVSNGSTTGLPGGVSFDLVGDPDNAARLYTSVIYAPNVGGLNGVYRSDDTGATWTKVSDVAIDGILTDGSGNVEMATGPGGVVWLGVINSGVVAGFFRSPDSGATWAAMDLPGTATLGIHPGGQGGIHFSLSGDPSNPNLVYVGGDRQDFPNEIGATDYTGNLFRGDASQPSGSQWTHLTNYDNLGPAGGGTASNTAPHADSREMAIDANGQLIEVDDGGVYRRTSPQNNTGDWFSINGDIEITELHDASWDAVSGVGLGGAQDTGSPAQSQAGSMSWFSVSTADGGDVAIDAISTPGYSTRFTSYQELSGFRRQVYDSAGVYQSQTFPALTVIGGGAPLVTQFVTPLEVNAVDGFRLIIGGGNSVYESFDHGDTIAEVGPGIIVNSFGRDPIAYGATGNSDVLYVGSGNDVYVRTAAPPAALVFSTTLPGAVVDIVVDPDDSAHAWAITSSQVHRTQNSGGVWSEVTGDLQTLAPGFLHSMAFMARTVGDAIAVGGDTGVFVLHESDGFTGWQKLGTGLPAVPVYDLDDDPSADELLAGTLGRGAWKLRTLDPVIFSDGFESGDTTMWSTTQAR